MKQLFMCLLIGLCYSCSSNSSNESDANKNSLPYVLDMVHDNPGEDIFETKYRDPNYTKSVGLNGIVPRWYVQCGLTYESFDPNLFDKAPEAKKWIENQRRFISEKLKEAKDVGQPVYAFTDVLVLPQVLLEKYRKEIQNPKDLNKKTGFNLHGKLVPDIKQSMTRELVKIQVDELFKTFPDLDGLVVRFGETYLFDTPYHAGGNPIHGNEQEKIEGHVTLINILREEICEKRNKKLFYRTWDFGFLHTRRDIYLAITDQIKPHPNLNFSIKYGAGDFHRLTVFNPTLGVGKHNYIVEFQGQPEYYGKGAHPIYTAKGMIEGWEEFDQINPEGRHKGVRELLKDPKMQGLWTWSRGGGWRGPYLKNEMWCDLNTRVAINWARDTTLTEADALRLTSQQVGVAKQDIDKFMKLVHLSADGAVRGHGTLIDLKKSRFNIWWMRDQYFSGIPALNGFFQYALKNGKVEDVLKEKEECTAIWKEIERLSQNIQMEIQDDEDYLRVSSTYGRIKYEIIEQGFNVMLLGMKGDQNGTYETQRIKRALNRYDELWEEWSTLKARNPSCATLYEPLAFGMNEKGVYGKLQGSLKESIDTYRTKLKL